MNIALLLFAIGIIAIIIAYSIITHKVPRIPFIRKKKPLRQSQLNQEEDIIFDLIKNHRAIFLAEIIAKTGYTKRKVKKIIKKFRKHDMIEQYNQGPARVVVLKD